MRALTLFLFLTLFLITSGNTQDSDLDIRKASIFKLPDDTTKVRQLYDLAVAYDQENWEKGLKYFHQTYRLAKKLNAYQWLPKIEYKIAKDHANIGNLDSALWYVQPAIMGYNSLGDWKGEALCYNLSLFVLKRQGEYVKANDYAFKALSIYEAHEYTKGIASTYGKIGSLFYWLEKWEDALTYTQKSYNLAKAENLLSQLAYAAQLLADLHLQFDDPEKALTYQSEGLTISRQRERTYDVANSLTSRGNIFLALERYPEALSDFRESLMLCKKLGTTRMENVGLQNIGITYNLLRQYDKALPYHLNGLSYIKKEGMRYLEETCYEQLAITYAGLNRFDSAYHYQQLNKMISDSLRTTESNHQISELQTQYETSQKEATIHLQEERLARQRTGLWAIGIILLLSVLAGGVLFRLTQILRSRNKEKEFLIKEIHHRVKNNLQILSSLLYLQSKHINDDAALDAVREGQNRVEAMGLIHQKLYMGDNLAAVNMQDYLYNLGDTLLDTFRLDDQVKIIYHLEPIHLDVDTAIPLGLIINELVTNALKYAFPDNRSGTIEISLWKNNANKLCLKVADDGVGKNTAPPLNSSTSFGSSLIEILSKKLKGTPQVLNGEGYTTLIEFEKFKLAKS